MDLTYVYTMRRGQLGRQPMFAETMTTLCDSISPEVEIQKQFILRNPVHQLVQNTRPMSIKENNTYRADYTTTGMVHDEGGWPKDININDIEATQRYRRRIEKEDAYIHAVNVLAPSMEHYVFQNNAINLYESYYSDMKALPSIEKTDCRKVNIYRDHAKKSKRPISSICWEPEGGYKFATSYVDLDFDLNPRSSLECYIWDVENALTPDITLTPPFAMIDIQYNPREITLLAGGLVNGQVCSYDLRTPKDTVLMCPMHVSHRDLVRNVLFVNAKHGMEFFSGSADGAVKWWDLRKMSEPVEEIILEMVASANDEPSMARANGVSVLEFEPTIPTRFMVGTENGYVLMGIRKGKNAQDKLPGKYTAHLGPVWKVERNPGFMKTFLTVGDMTARIWSEECRESSIMWTPFHRHSITDGAWSPTRFSLMLLTKSNGVLSIWDLLRHQKAPVLNVTVCEHPLTRLGLHEEGKFVACGDKSGDIYLLELSKNLCEFEMFEKGQMTSIFERETKRERILEVRMREIKLKQRQAEEASPTGSIGEDDPTVGDKDLAEAAAEFMNVVKKEHQP